MLHFPSDLTHYHLPSGRNSHMTSISQMGEWGPPNGMTSLRSQSGTPLSILVSAGSLLQSLWSGPCRDGSQRSQVRVPESQAGVLGQCQSCTRSLWSLCPLPGHRPSQPLPLIAVPAQKVRHLPSSLQPNLLPAPAPQAGPWGMEQLQSLDLIT